MSHGDEVVAGLARNASNQQLWGELYDLLAPRLRLFAYSLIRQCPDLDLSQGDDIVHDVLLAFVRNFPRLRGELASFAHVHNYLMKACRNRVRNLTRHSAVRQTAEEMLSLRFSEAWPDRLRRALAKAENRRFVDQILGRLESACADLVRAYLFEDKALAEYAADRGIPLGTIYSRWQRCVQSMRKIIGEEGKEKPG